MRGLREKFNVENNSREDAHRHVQTESRSFQRGVHSKRSDWEFRSSQVRMQGTLRMLFIFKILYKIFYVLCARIIATSQIHAQTHKQTLSLYGYLFR